MNSRRRGPVTALALAATSLVALAATACSAGLSASTTTGAPRSNTTVRPSTTQPSATQPPTTSGATTTSGPSTTLPGHWTEVQQLAQLIMVGGDFSDLQAVSSAVQQGAGGLVLFGMPAAGDGPSIKSGLAALQSRAAVHLLVSTDEEGGDIARLANVVGAMPWPRNMANTMTPSQVQGLVAKNAAAMAALGVNMDLAPVLDTASANDVIDEENLRSFSENGSTAAAYGIAFITGLRSAGMIATAKHFPGLGHANGNTDLGSASDPPLTQLVGNDLVPFRAAIDNGVGAVMMSNVTEPTWGSAPASLNPGAYRYLRSLGFTGMVITDSLDAYAIRDAGYTAAEAVPKAIEAGADMAMVGTPSEFGPALGALESAVQDGQLSMTQVTASVERILKLKHI